MTAREKAKLIVNRITSWAPWSAWHDVSRREIEIKITVGLEEYAKEQAIAFAIHYAKSAILNGYVKPSAIDSDRMEDRYNLFIEQQNKNK